MHAEVPLVPRHRCVFGAGKWWSSGLCTKSQPAWAPAVPHWVSPPYVSPREEPSVGLGRNPGRRLWVGSITPLQTQGQCALCWTPCRKQHPEALAQESSMFLRRDSFYRS